MVPNALDCCVVTGVPALLVVLVATGLGAGRPWGDETPSVIRVLSWLVPIWVTLMVLIRVGALVEIGRTAPSSWPGWVAPAAFVGAAVDAAFLGAVLFATVQLARRWPGGATSLARMSWLMRGYHVVMGALAVLVAMSFWRGGAVSEVVLSLGFVLLVAVAPGFVVPILLDRAVAVANGASPTVTR